VEHVGRAVLAVFAFGLGFALTGGLLFTLLAPAAPEAWRTATGLACGLLAGAAVWRATAAAPPGLGRSMVKGAGLFGLIGFLGGFVGPMLFAPDSNQGPLLGIFITGPGGVVLGALAGAAWSAVRNGSGGASP
jgi:hypothetical protein